MVEEADDLGEASDDLAKLYADVSLLHDIHCAGHLPGEEDVEINLEEALGECLDDDDVADILADLSATPGDLEILSEDHLLSGDALAGLLASPPVTEHYPFSN